MLEGFGHAVNHLVLDRLRRYAKRFSRRFNHRQTAEIVGTEGGTNDLPMAEQQGNESLIICVGVSLVFEQGHRPSHLMMADRVRIPIGSFDETNRDRCAAPLRPCDELAHILCRLAMIGLQRQTGLRKRPVGVFGKQSPENGQQQIFALGLLHVEYQSAGAGGRKFHDRPEPRRHRAVRPVLIDGIQSGRERRNLERQLHARKHPQMVLLRQTERRPTAGGLTQPGDCLQTAIPVLIRFEITDRRLAQQIDRPGTAVFPQPRKDGEGLSHRPARDERPRHLLDLMPDRLAGDGRPHTGRRQRLQPPLQPEHVPVHGTEVLVRQFHNRSVRRQGGKHIDETKQLHLEGRILHGQVDHTLRPPPALEHRRSPACR